MSNREWTSPMEWENAGTEPSAALKASGFAAGYKPPAGVFNFFLKRAKDCIEELQVAVDDVEDAHNAGAAICVVTSGGTGAAYTASVPTVTTLTAGAVFVLVPHAANSNSPTIKVNSLAEKGIRRRVSNSTTTTTTVTAGVLAANKPVLMIYDGTYWIADIQIPNAADIYGTVSIAKGGTGASNAADARANLEIGSYFVMRGIQAAKTSAMTQAVGIDANGKLWSLPPGTGDGGGVSGSGSGITLDDVAGYLEEEGYYKLPSGGIQSADINESLLWSLSRVAVLVTNSNGSLIASNTPENIHSAIEAGTEVCLRTETGVELPYIYGSAFTAVFAGIYTDAVSETADIYIYRVTSSVQKIVIPVASGYKVGDLSYLNTTEKSTIVGAINEIYTALGSYITDVAELVGGDA